MTSLGRFCAIVALIFAALTATAFSSPPPYPQWPLPPSAAPVNNARRGINPNTEFGIFYNCSSDNLSWYNFDYGAAPLRLDCILIPAGAASLYPMQGPHMIELYPGGRTLYYTNFLTQLTTIVTGWITSANYDGLIVLDYEWFSPWYTGHLNFPSNLSYDSLDGDFIDDWRDTLRVTRAAAIAGMNPAQQETYFKQEWMTTTQEFFTRVYQTIKTLRPSAKVGFYAQPSQSYWEWRDPAKAAAMRIGHDEVPWFWQMVDIVLPSVFPIYQSVPDHRTAGYYQDHESDFDQYCRDNIGEALRVASGKPVYPYVGFQYHASNPVYGWQPVNYFNLRRPFEVARELGCNGVVIWGWFRTQAAYDMARPYYPSTLAPFVTRFATLPTYAPANPSRPRRVE